MSTHTWMDARNRAREELARLESVAEILGPYAEHHELIVEWPPNHFQSAAFTPRSEGCAAALIWLTKEIELVRKRLAEYEREAVA